jgi:hypothetical protein
MSIHQDPAEKITTGLSYSAAAANIVFGLTINEISILVGIFLAMATFLINWYYKHQGMKLKEKLLEHHINEALSEDD